MDSTGGSTLCTEFLLIACCFRQALIIILRKSGKNSIIHVHEQITFLPLTWTIVSCLLGLFTITQQLAPSLSQAHLGLVFTPQVLTWFWCLQSRGEIKKSDFTAHCIGFAAILLLLQTGSFYAYSIALFSSAVAFLKRSSCPRSRQSFIWFVLVLISLLKCLTISVFVDNWSITLSEVAMMFVMKFKLPFWFVFDQRNFDAKGSTVSTPYELTTSEPDSDGSVVSESSPRDYFKKSGPLLSFESNMSEDAAGFANATSTNLTGLTRSDSLNSRTPDLISSGRPPSHRRDVSAQSSGSGWAWGLAVQDLVAKSLSPPSSSDEDDDDEDMA